MHRFTSKSTIYRFRIAAFMLWFTSMTAPVTGGILVYSFVRNDLELMAAAMAAGIVCALIRALQWGIAERTRCPLCMTPVLANKGCSKHRNARTLLGSHRLRVAMQILFLGSFRCPYCHESSAMEVRPRHGKFRNKYS